MCGNKDVSYNFEQNIGQNVDALVNEVGMPYLEVAPVPEKILRLRSGFAQSLTPNLDDQIFKRFEIAKTQIELFSSRISEQLLNAGRLLRPDFSVQRKLEFLRMQHNVANLNAGLTCKQISDQQTVMLDGFQSALKQLVDPKISRGFRRALLPPNLRDYAEEIDIHQVRDFLELEGIPLYLVPHGDRALRLLRAKDRPGRRKVLGDCYKSIINDCVVVLERANQAVIGDELTFVFDGLGAMQSGFSRSAQAMLTVTLDTLIYRFYPEPALRRSITNRPKEEADPPEIIDDMSIHEAMVWLPIWNAHEQFWKHKGDQVPRHYSRHASVHGVSSRQFSKRNCVQVLMLVTSLIGYADRFMRLGDCGDG